MIGAKKLNRAGYWSHEFFRRSVCINQNQICEETTEVLEVALYLDKDWNRLMKVVQFVYGNAPKHGNIVFKAAKNLFKLTIFHSSIDVFKAVSDFAKVYNKHQEKSK